MVLEIVTAVQRCMPLIVSPPLFQFSAPRALVMIPHTHGIPPHFCDSRGLPIFRIRFRTIPIRTVVFCGLNYPPGFPGFKQKATRSRPRIRV